MVEHQGAAGPYCHQVGGAVVIGFLRWFLGLFWPFVTPFLVLLVCLLIQWAWDVHKARMAAAANKTAVQP